MTENARKENAGLSKMQLGLKIRNLEFAATKCKNASLKSSFIVLYYPFLHFLLLHLLSHIFRFCIFRTLHFSAFCLQIPVLHFYFLHFQSLCSTHINAEATAVDGLRTGLKVKLLQAVSVHLSRMMRPEII